MPDGTQGDDCYSPVNELQTTMSLVFCQHDNGHVTTAERVQMARAGSLPEKGTLISQVPQLCWGQPSSHFRQLDTFPISDFTPGRRVHRNHPAICWQQLPSGTATAFQKG